MLSRSRLAVSLCGLALAVPTLPVWAAPDDGQAGAVAQPTIRLQSAPMPSPSGGYPQSAGYQPSGYVPSAGSQPVGAYPLPVGYQSSGGNPSAMGSQPSVGYLSSTPTAVGENQPVPAQHHHKGLFGWRHCVECQRARVKAHDGIDIPPPPSQAGMVYQGPAMVTGPMVMNDPRGVVVNGSQEAGYAVIGPGGPEDAAGYAIVGGPGSSAEPTPIGLARGGMNPWADPRMAAMSPRPGAGPYDPAVVPSALPPAQSAMSGPGHDRPHILSHVFSIPRFGAHREEREERQREKHAAIAYGDPTQKVTELPASVVYGKGTSR